MRRPRLKVEVTPSLLPRVPNIERLIDDIEGRYAGLDLEAARAQARRDFDGVLAAYRDPEKIAALVTGFSYAALHLSGGAP